MRRTLVIGASPDPNRYSYMAIKRLVAHNEGVLAFGLKEGEVDGVKIVTEALSFKNVDTVTLYLNPKNQRQFYKYIVSLNPKRVIFNPGTENPEFYELLKKKDIAIEVACTLVLLTTGQY